MVKNKQVKKSDGKERRVQRVLDYHNKKYGTHIEVKGKTQNLRSDLKGKSDWDLVCYDMGTGDEVAIEVKKLTEQALEKKQKYCGNSWRKLEIVFQVNCQEISICMPIFQTVITLQ